MPKVLKAELERQFKVLSQRWDEDGMKRSLPLPRMEVEFTPNGPSEINCVVRLVTGHLRGATLASVILWRTATTRFERPPPPHHGRGFRPQANPPLLRV